MNPAAKLRLDVPVFPSPRPILPVASEPATPWWHVLAIELREGFPMSSLEFQSIGRADTCALSFLPNHRREASVWKPAQALSSSNAQCFRWCLDFTALTWQSRRTDKRSMYKSVARLSAWSREKSSLGTSI